MMACLKCQKTFDQCVCEDLEARLDTAKSFVYKKCQRCGKHYARCRCENPDFVASMGGQIYSLLAFGFSDRQEN